MTNKPTKMLGVIIKVGSDELKAEELSESNTPKPHKSSGNDVLTLERTRAGSIPPFACARA